MSTCMFHAQLALNTNGVNGQIDCFICIFLTSFDPKGEGGDSKIFIS